MTKFLNGNVPPPNPLQTHGSSRVTITTEIGSFSINHVDTTAPPMVSIHTKDAPIFSPKAKEFLEKLVKGKDGIAEIVEVTTYPNKVVLTLSDEITDYEATKTIATAFMRRLQTAVEGFDELDTMLWRDAQLRQIDHVDTSCKENNHSPGRDHNDERALF